MKVQAQVKKKKLISTPAEMCSLSDHLTIELTGNVYWASNTVTFLYFSSFFGWVSSQTSKHKLALRKWILDSKAHSERESTFVSWATLFSQVR